MEKIKNIWYTLEEYAKNKKVLQIGLSDVEENVFRIIYEWATIKPSIIQINLATCCVVPPTLQAFCKEKEVQLLTHSDPNGKYFKNYCLGLLLIFLVAEILPEDSLGTVFGTKLILNWVVRFLVHIKCRGVLATKGYLISFNK